MLEKGAAGLLSAECMCVSSVLCAVCARADVSAGCTPHGNVTIMYSTETMLET